MRNVLSLAAVGVTLSVLALGCGDASLGSGAQLRRSSPAAGEHDPDDVGGENAQDPGNPNASSAPAPPSTPGQTTGEVTMALSNVTPAVDLGDQVELTVTVTPAGGFKGDAELTAAGLPVGTTATFTPAKVTLNTTAVTAKLLLKVAVTTTTSAPGTSSPLVVTAKTSVGEATANASFKVNPKMKLTIPVNLDALRTTGTKFLDQWGTAFGTNEQALTTQAGNGIVVTVFNADSTIHIIHGNAGFAHGSTTAGEEIQPNAYEIQNGTPRTRTMNVGTNTSGYPHEGGAGASVGFRILVQAPPQ